MHIRPADKNDIPGLLKIINAAYRGEASRKGWTTEADFIKGDIRTDEEDLDNLLTAQGNLILKYCNDSNKIEGCVFLQLRFDGMYFGMLSVNPDLQARGIGRQLMQAAETIAKQRKCTRMYMRVISGRTELIGWYKRLGYHPTGETQPFPEGRFGIPNKPLEFIVMEKIF